MIDLININLEIISFALIMNKYVNTMYVICKLKKKENFLTVLEMEPPNSDDIKCATNYKLIIVFIFNLFIDIGIDN